MLYRIHLDMAGFDLKTLVVIGADCTCSYKSIRSQPRRPLVVIKRKENIYVNVNIHWEEYCPVFCFVFLFSYSEIDRIICLLCLYIWHYIYPLYYLNIFFDRSNPETIMYTRGGSRGRPRLTPPPPKIWKNMICLRKIVIFHTKCPKHFRASLRSARIF